MNTIQSHNNGGYDFYLLKLWQNGSSLVYSTYLGGAADEISQGIALDTANNAYVTGWTRSPTLSLGGPQIRTYSGMLDGFLLKVNSTGSAVVYCTYIGGANDDNAFGVAVDPLNQAYVTGYTYSSDFPTKNAFQSQYHTNNDEFLPAGNSEMTGPFSSTYLGGSNRDPGRAISPQS